MNDVLVKAIGDYNLTAPYWHGRTEAFKAGAEWQKEQDKELLNQAYQLLSAYDIRYPHTTQLLVGHLNEDIMNRLYERLYPNMNNHKTEAQNNKPSY